MAIVVDASVALAWCFPDEADLYADSVLDALQNESALAPAVWPLEVVNGLLIGVRRGRIVLGDLPGAEQILDGLRISVVPPALGDSFGNVAALASQLGLTAYDASYVHLAIRENAALATLDERLRAAAAAARCRIFEPA